MPSITSANSVAIFTCPPIYPVPQQLQGYSTDSAFETEGSESAEVMKGVDGIMSWGFTPFMVRQTYHFQADSSSAFIFETVLEAEKTILDKYPVFMTLLIPSIGRKYNCTNGILTNVIQVPGAAKVLQARAFVITWDNISPTAL